MKSLSLSVLAATLLGAALLAWTPPATPVQEAPKDANAEIVRDQKPCYPLKTCPISKHELGADAVDTVIDGRLVRVCCKDCVEPAQKQKAEIFKAIDAAVVEQQTKGYPLEKCPISGEALKGNENVVNHVHGTRLIRFCCNDCVKAFQKDPAPVLKKLDNGYIAMQKASYPLDTCIVSGEKLGGMGEPLDHLYGNRLFRLCCAGCKKAVAKDADGLWAKLETARAEKKGEKKG